MPDTIGPLSQGPAAGNRGGAGCAVFLIDESMAMDARVAGGTKSKAESVATALNSLLNQLTTGPAIDVAIVGYRTTEQAGQEIGPRWGGALADRQFVSSTSLADAPLSVETRVRRVPGEGGVGVTREESVQFPVWYAVQLGGTASRATLFEHCREMLSAWIAAAGAQAKPPLVVSFVGEIAAEETPQGLGRTVQELETPGGPPIVIHAHLSSSDRVPATLYPSSDTHLSPGPIRGLFEASSVLSQEFCASLRELQVTVNPGARGLIYNAKMVDLIRLLSLVKSYAQNRPRVAPPTATAAVSEETPTVQIHGPDAPTVQLVAAQVAVEPVLSEAVDRALVVLLLDRSVEDPTAGKEKSAWRRIEEQADEILGQIAKRAPGRIDVALVSYGTEADGRTSVETTFSGPLAGRTVVADADLASGAIRVEEVAEQVSNGIGGLVSLTRKKPVFVDRQPSAVAAPAAGFSAVKDLLIEWRKERTESRLLPVVLHMTRGRFEPGQIDEAVDQLREAGQLVLCHQVFSESPHASLAYPAEPTKIQDAGIKKLWELTSPLLEGRALAGQRRGVSSESRAMVINGKFDLLLDSIEEALKTPEAGPEDTNPKES
jgi:hypothetical protein